MNPQEHPELDAFLASLRPGDLVSGTVAAVERFGVFVQLDDGPRHPDLPGVGFVTIPELSCRTWSPWGWSSARRTSGSATSWRTG